MGPQRSDVEFTSQGVTCRAWLYLPESDDPAPIIVMAHGLGGIRDMRLDAFAERFCDAGYAALVFDYRHFGASDGEPRQLISVKRQRQDWAAAIAFARSLGTGENAQVDGSRVVLWGTSFSGGHVFAVAAQVPGISAVISQGPFTDGVASTLALGPVSGAKVVVRALADLIAAARGRPPVEVPIAGPPGSGALMTAPDALPGYGALMPDGQIPENHTPARAGLSIPLQRPGASIATLTCPTLVCVCDDDSVAPAPATMRFLRNAPSNVQVNHYSDGHFEIYVGDAFENVIADQVDFLDRVVPLS